MKCNGTDTRRQADDPGPGSARPEFRNALLKEGIEALLAGTWWTPARRSCATTSRPRWVFEQLGGETGSSPTSLIRVFGPSGNPQARNLFAVISCSRWRRAVLSVVGKQSSDASEASGTAPEPKIINHQPLDTST